MVIGGVVIRVHPDERKDIEIILSRYPELSVYGSDEKGNIIATITGKDSVSMKAIIKTIENHNSVMGVSLAYLNAGR